jgi:glycine hydroxymethyltransferase
MVDRIETLASDHAKALFGAEHAYVQPHSGIDANLVAYWAILAHRVEQPFLDVAGVGHVNDLDPVSWEQLRNELNSQRMMGMALDAGGHLTHGFRPNISGKLFDQASYGVDPTSGLLDYGAIATQVRQFRPLVLVAGYSAYPRNPNFATLAQIAHDVGATFMVDMAHFAGLVAGKVLVGDLDPVAHADVVTSTTHKSLRGPRGGLVLCREEYAPYVDKGCPMVLGGPLPHVMAAKAVALSEARQPSFATYATQIVENARALADGLLARGAHLITGGTDNHLVLLDVASSFGLTGRQAEAALLDAGVVSNRNSVPNDANGAWYTSGIRLGTPALTTLGFRPDELDEVADVIVTVLRTTTPVTSTAKAKYEIDARVAKACRNRCGELLAPHRLYREIEL